MSENKDKQPDKKPANVSFMRGMSLWVLFFMVFLFITNSINNGALGGVEKLRYDEFFQMVEKNTQEPVIASVVKKLENEVQGAYTDEYAKRHGFERFKVYVPLEDKDLIPLLRTNVKKFEVEQPPTLLMNFLMPLLPLVLLLAGIWYLTYRGNQMGSRVWGFGRAKATMIEKEKTKITFRDVAGIEEAKEELKEVIAFLKDPKRFQKLGGRIPKGVLLVGGPGVGKTLLAKAVAGEADVPFFSISGSDFVELFVGVGASRVRDLFEQAKKAAKVGGRGGIIFIDEIDAVGRLRFAGIGGGHDEREQTLNQLLAEMDGFQTQEGIVVMAATNRPDVLDPALLRPGRFDRHVVIDAPDIKGREAILKVHTRKIKLATNADLNMIAKQTPGFSGADLENLCNEAALLAARRNKEAVENEELQESIERVIAGPQRKSRVISKKEKEIIAFHESGHALLALLLKDVDPLHKVSIIPRGVGALGYTMQMPIQDRYIHTKTELSDRMCVLLGGRAAEELALGEVTTGAGNDLEVATAIARRMVTEFGMSDRIGHRTMGRKEAPVFLGKEIAEHRDYSDDSARLIDEEVKHLVEDAYLRGKDLLNKNMDKLKALSQKLLEKEVMDVKEVRELTGLKEEKKDENNPSADKG